MGGAAAEFRLIQALALTADKNHKGAVGGKVLLTS